MEVCQNKRGSFVTMEYINESRVAIHYDIPLSEMKLFLKREIAEKHIELKTNDEIQIKGTVFSDALGDAWIDVTGLTLIKKAPEKKDGVV